MDDVRPRQEIVVAQQEAQAGVELYRSRCINVTDQLYQMLMFYTLFQGVLFTAVATASKLSCQTSCLPALLSLLTSIVTACGVHSKLTLFEVERVKLIKQEKSSWDYLMLLDKNPGVGSSTLKRLEPDERKKDEDLKKKDEDLKEKVVAERWSLKKTYGAVMLCLFIYSLLLLACCVVPLCWNHEDTRSTLTLCAFNWCLEKSFTLHTKNITSSG